MADHLRYYVNLLMPGIAMLGFYLGGQFVWLGSVGVLAFIALVDSLTEDDYSIQKIKYPWVPNLALYLHLPMLVVMYLVFAWRINQGFDQPSDFMTGLAYMGAIFSFGFQCAVPTLPIAHELMHRRDSFSRVIASIMGIFYCDPNRDIAHVFIHHIHVGTDKDSDTATRGSNMYSFMVSASWESYKEGYLIEKERQAKNGRSVWSLQSRVPSAIFMVMGYLGISFVLGGWVLLVAVAISTFLAKMFAEGPNYTQHYGLLRVPGTPFESRHTWEHASPTSRAVAVEITTHANHHTDSYAPFYELQPSDKRNHMPSIFTCFFLASVPPLWFRLVKPRLKDWDLNRATPEERELAKKANKKAGWEDWFSESRNV